MRPLLNTLGVTLWGMIAITLAVTLATVGYRITGLARAPIYRDAPPASRDLPARIAAPIAAPIASPAEAIAPIVAAARPPTKSEETPRTRFYGAVDAQRYAEAAQYGQLYDSGHATVTDLAPICLRAMQCVRKISRIIATEMTAAQKALQAQQWQEAIKNLEAAEQKPGLNAFDKKTIYNFKGFADIKLNNLKAAQGEFEKALATGAATSEETASMTRTLFGIGYGKQLVDAGTATTDNLGIIAQSYYQLKDCKDSIVWADKAIAAARKAGEAPKENFFLFKLQCASDASDTPAMDAVLMDLIKLNNKTTYWNTLLRIERQDERDDHNTLMIYRIMYNTNSMNADTDYIEMAQLLGDAALPGEAAAVLDKAMGTGVIKDEHKERTTRLSNSLRARADVDRKNLPALEMEADKNAAGTLDVRLGEIYYGFGDYQRAADAIDRGLQKGGVNRLDEAYVYLGLAQTALKSPAEAHGAFADLAEAPDVGARILALWRLFSATQI